LAKGRKEVRVRSQAEIPAPTFGVLAVGDTVAERSERGTVSFTGRVRSIGPCTDAANVHLELLGVGKYVGGKKTWCAVKADSVERWDREI